MSYRGNNQKALAWREWVRKNEAGLSECGLPEIVLKSESHWWDFLMHGYLDHHDDPSSFTVDHLSKEEMRSLKAFLEFTLSADEARSAIILLELESKLSNAVSDS